MWTSLVILLYALFASVFTIGKWGLDHAEPIFLMGSRMFLAGILMLTYLFIFKREQFFMKKEHFWRIVRLAAFNIYLTNAFEFWGLKYLSSAKTCFLYGLSPFFSAIFAFFLLTERMTKLKLLGLSIGFLGFLPILFQKTAAEEQIGNFFYFSWPELAITGAVISSVYGWILLKQLCDENNYSPLMANGWSMLLGGTMALLHSKLTENWNPVPVSNYTIYFASAFLLIIISNMLCYNIYGVLVRRFSATYLSFAGIMTPIFSAIFGWLFLQETITWHFYLSFFIVSIGLLFFHRDEMKPQVVVSQN